MLVFSQFLQFLISKFREFMEIREWYACKDNICPNCAQER